jgi:N-dimethylarginine dimethylaminohydrolase
MAAPLRRVLVCSPEAAGWGRVDAVPRWRELGYLHQPDLGKARAQHRILVSLLEKAKAEVISLDAAGGLTPDAVYTHDPSFLTDRGAILLQMGKGARAEEPAHHGRIYRKLGIPVLGRIEPPGTVEAGDLMWLDPSTLLAGRGYRTNRAGLEQMRSLLGTLAVEVIEAPLPHGQGPSACLHLMSLLSVLAEKTLLVDRPWLAVSTVELLQERGFDFVEIETEERMTQACNVLALGDRCLLSIEENRATNERLRRAGFDVRSFPGAEICQNGGGGPTCLTRPLLRG